MLRIAHTLLLTIVYSSNISFAKRKGWCRAATRASAYFISFVPAILHHTRAFQAVSYSLDSGLHHIHCRYTYWLIGSHLRTIRLFWRPTRHLLLQLQRISLHFLYITYARTISVNQCTITCTDVTLMYINSRILFSAYLQ